LIVEEQAVGKITQFRLSRFHRFHHAVEAVPASSGAVTSQPCREQRINGIYLARGPAA
jgi:hypothetical protein